MDGILLDWVILLNFKGIIIIIVGLVWYGFGFDLSLIGMVVA